MLVWVSGEHKIDGIGGWSNIDNILSLPISTLARDGRQVPQGSSLRIKGPEDRQTIVTLDVATGGDLIVLLGLGLE